MKRRWPAAIFALASLAAFAAPEDRVAETIDARLVPADGRFEFFPRWVADGQPPLSLALSGGGARGLAHLGVLAAMREDGVSFDALAGTSIGAMAGAFVAAGYLPEEIVEILRRRDWNAIIVGLDVRNRILSESEDVRRASALFRYRWRRGRLLQVGALTESRTLEREMYRYMLSAQLLSGGDFDRLRFRFRPVATDILTGDPVVPAGGDLVTAVRGSFAIPGVFRPVPFGEAQLVDGGLVENIPVRTTRRFGPAVVVAVDVTEGLPRAAWLRGTLDNLNRSVGILMAQQGRDSLQLADLVLSPDVLKLSQADFAGNIDSYVIAGRLAYDANRDALWRLLEESASDRAPVAWDRIEVTGSARIGTDELAARLGGAPGHATRWRVRSELARLLNFGPFEDGRVEVVESASGRVLRFALKENPPLKTVARHGDAVPGLDDLDVPIPIGEPFSWELARQVSWRLYEALVERGQLLVNLAGVAWDPATGLLSLDLREVRVNRVRTEVEGELRLETTERNFSDLQGGRFRYDRLADRLDEMVLRGSIFDWSLRPAAGPDGTVDVTVRVRGDDYFEASAGGAYRDSLGWAGYARAAKSNLTGRGDFFDFTAAGSEEQSGLQTRYRSEYLGRFRNVGFEAAVRAVEYDPPIIGSNQRADAALNDKMHEIRASVSIIHRLRFGAVAQLGLQHASDRFDEGVEGPAERRSRTSVRALFDLDRRDRLLFPTRGGGIRLSFENSVGGDDLRRAEVRAGQTVTFGKNWPVTLTARGGAGVSDHADRRAYWFDPGGFRDLYGFVPFGAAAPNYRHAGLTARLKAFDVATVRVYFEAGADTVRTSFDRSSIGVAPRRTGWGVSLSTLVRPIGPATLGWAKNDDGGNVFFLTLGYSFLEGD